MVIGHDLVAKLKIAKIFSAVLEWYLRKFVLAKIMVYILASWWYYCELDLKYASVYAILYSALAHAGSGTVVPSLTTITSKYGTFSAVQIHGKMSLNYNCYT